MFIVLLFLSATAVIAVIAVRVFPMLDLSYVLMVAVIGGISVTTTQVESQNRQARAEAARTCLLKADASGLDPRRCDMAAAMFGV